MKEVAKTTKKTMGKLGSWKVMVRPHDNTIYLTGADVEFLLSLIYFAELDGVVFGRKDNFKERKDKIKTALESLTY